VGVVGLLSLEDARSDGLKLKLGRVLTERRWLMLPRFARENDAMLADKGREAELDASLVAGLAGNVKDGLGSSSISALEYVGE
jgi:hypothetical protein